MNDILRSISVVAAVFTLLAGAACVTESSNDGGNRSTPPANTDAASAPPTAPEPAPPTPDAALNTQAVTLAVIDAFFAQEGFAEDLKSKLRLTDDQVNSLRSIARRETSKLRESDNDDQYAGNTRAAREDALEKSKAIIGEEKSRELVAFVNERWNGNAAASTSGGASPSGTSPSAVPRDSGAIAAGVPKDNRVVVNTPAFRMDLFEDGKLIKSYKIGIGYPEFPLPTGQRKAETIIFNPTWTPPDEAWVESPGSKVKVGEKIEAGDKLNPLGPIKIPIGLPSLIHGSKAPAKLGGFASHGCVGLTTPQINDFVRRLAQLSGTPLSDEQISEFEKNKKDTKTVKLSKPVPVELRYETITVEDGKLHIYRDVYDRGTNTQENLARVLQSYGVTMDQLNDSERAEVTSALNQMARDARGHPTADASDAKSLDNANSSAPFTKSKKSGPRKEESKNGSPSGKVTRSISGSKEMIVQISASVGKGYPAPVELDAGSAPKSAAPRAARRRK